MPAAALKRVPTSYSVSPDPVPLAPAGWALAKKTLRDTPRLLSWGPGGGGRGGTGSLTCVPSVSSSHNDPTNW